VLSPEGERKPRPFLTAMANEVHAAFTPDDRFVAYAYDETGVFQIFVVPFPDPVARWPISTEGGTHPVWAKNGRELFYRNGAKIMVVDVTTKPTFSAGTPRLLFEQPRFPGWDNAGYDVADDRRFLMVMGSGEEPKATEFNVIQNWLEDLKIRVAVR
jgi:eukaryotic-like serine/threonine-protein kinase